VTPLNTVEPQTQEPAAQWVQLQDMIATARPNLSDTETWQLEELVAKYKGVFATNSSGYGQIDRVYRCIKAGEAWPIRQPPGGSL
jgi:hypothetical protein